MCPLSDEVVLAVCPLSEEVVLLCVLSVMR